jgi:hypothetical protein
LNISRAPSPLLTRLPLNYEHNFRMPISRAANAPRDRPYNPSAVLILATQISGVKILHSVSLTYNSIVVCIVVPPFQRMKRWILPSFFLFFEAPPANLNTCSSTSDCSSSR